MEKERRKKKKMNKELATQQQIRKLYAIVLSNGKDPKEYAEKLKKENGLNSLNEFTKDGISELISQLENQIENTPGPGPTPTPGPTPIPGPEETEEVEALEEDKDSEIDAIFSKCLVRASNIASDVIPRAKITWTDKMVVRLILEISKIYLEEARKGREK